MEQNYSSNFKRCSDEDAKDSPNLKRLKTKETDTKNEELHFYNLFIAVLNFIIERNSITEETISEGISSIIQSFRYDQGNKFSDIKFEDTDKLCGYLFRYAPHGAGLVRSRVLDAFNNCTVLKETLKQPELNIVSLGGGPGNDIVGFCSALYEYNCCSRLNITVVDSVQRWSSCLNLAEYFIREDEFGNVSELFRKNPVTMSFTKATLPGTPNSDPKYFRSLKEADIIIMAKLFSILEWEDKYGLSKSLYDEMKQETLLLFVDSPFQSEVWTEFDILYPSDPLIFCTRADYMMSEEVSEKKRFNRGLSKTSKAQIYVLRKKAPCQK